MGKNGMIWVKYNEFAKYCKYAYIIYVGQNKPIQTSASQTIKSSPVVASSNETLTEGNLNELPLRDISGKFYFLRFTGQFNSYSEPVFEEAKVLGEKNIYTLSNRLWKVGEKFQLQVVPSFSNGYIYVLSVDPNNKKKYIGQKMNCLMKNSEMSINRGFLLFQRVSLKSLMPKAC